MYPVTSSSGTSSPLLEQLAENHNRHLGITFDPLRAIPAPSPEKSPTGTATTGENSRVYRRGSKEADAEESHISGGCSTKSVHQSDICSPKEGWVTKARGKPKTTKHLCEEEPFQDGRSPYQEGRLDGLNRSERRIPIISGGSGTSQVFVIPMESVDLRVPMPPIRLEQCSSHLHEAPKTSHGNLKIKGLEIGNIYRRYPPHGTVTRRAEQRDPGGNSVPTTSGVYDQLGEVSADALPENHLPGLPNRFTSDDALSPRGEETTYPAGLQDSSVPGSSISSYPGEDDRQDDSNSSSDRPSTSSLQEAAKSKERGFQTHSVI